jgi:hypothetical protein
MSSVTSTSTAAITNLSERARRWDGLPAIAKARRYLAIANIDDPDEPFAYEMTRRDRIEAANALSALSLAESAARQAGADERMSVALESIAGAVERIAVVQP